MATMPDSSWDTTFDGHKKEDDPLVSIDVFIEQNKFDDDDTLITVGGLHIHVDPNGVLLLMDMLVAALSPQRLAENLLVEHFDDEALSVATQTRDAAVARLKATAEAARPKEKKR